jgi:hypothetical protein
MKRCWRKLSWRRLRYYPKTLLQGLGIKVNLIQDRRSSGRDLKPKRLCSTIFDERNVEFGKSEQTKLEDFVKIGRSM